MPEFSRQRARLAYDGPLDPVIDELSRAYELSVPESFEVIDLGYEDCNIKVETKQGAFVAKMFSKARTPENRDRYVTAIQRVLAAGVSHPRLRETSYGNVLFVTRGISMIVMDYIDGESFWESDRTPDDAELRETLRQASIINSIPYHPEYCYDSWAVPHVRELYERVKEFVPPDDLHLANTAIAKYEDIPLDELPHTFVHGDFTKANVVRDRSGRIFVLDFSVSNWYPRIQELAVITANLLHSSTSPASLGDRCARVVQGYEEFTPLTDLERKFLYDYSLAAVVSEFLGAYQEHHINGIKTKENEFWMQLGRNGLLMELGNRRHP